MIDYRVCWFLLFCYGVIAVIFLISLVILLFQSIIPDWKRRVKSLLIALAVIFAINVFAKVHALSDESDWKHYMFYIGSPTTGDDALRFGRRPKKTEYSYYDNKNPYRITSTHLYFDGYSLLFGATNGKICAVWVTEPGIIPLHGGIDIGSTREEVIKAMEGEDISPITGTEGEGYIFQHPGKEKAEGIWLYLEYDENDILVEFSLSDGF